MPRTESQKAHRREFEKRYRREKPEIVRAIMLKARAKWKERYPFRWKVTQIKDAANRRGLEWNLPYGLAIDLISDNCFYCGSIPDPWNGIDRVNNTCGYIEGNIVTACRKCNISKNKYNINEFEAWIERLTKRFNLWKGFTSV